MSQLSDETYKGDFVWEDPSSETKLIQDLFTEFNKGVRAWPNVVTLQRESSGIYHIGCEECLFLHGCVQVPGPAAASGGRMRGRLESIGHYPSCYLKLVPFNLIIS